MSAVALDFSQAQPLPQSQPVALDFSKAQPITAPDDRNAIQKSFDANTKTDPKEPLLETGLKSVVGAVGAPFVHPIDTLNSLGNLINPDVDKNPLVQAVQGVQNDYKAGGAGYAATKLAGNTVGGVALGGAAGAAAEELPALGRAASSTTSTALTKVQKALGNVPVAGQNYTPTHAAAFEGAIAPATAMGKNFIPQSVSEQALTPIRQTASNMAQGTPTQQGIVQAATSSSTPPLQRLGAYQSIVQQSLNDLESQHSPALAQAAATPVNTSAIVKQLQGLKSPTMAPADASAIDQLVDRVQQAKTIGDLNTFRQELNTETAPEFRQSQVQAGRSGISSQATSDLAGWVRNAYYDNLQNTTGTDFAPLKRQEANLITTQEALQNQQAPLAKAEALFAAPTTWRSKVATAANVIKDPKAVVNLTPIIKESPATPVSTMLQKSLADLPAPSTAIQTTPEAASSATSSLPQLGRGQIPTVQGTPVTPPSTLPPPTPAALPAPANVARPAQAALPSVPQAALPAGNGVQQLPASTAGYTPTQVPSSSPPPFNPATARMRVQPTQFSPQPTPTPSSGPIPVTPEGQGVTGAIQRYTGTPATTNTPAPSATPALRGQALWAQKGAAKLTQQLQQSPIAGVSAANLETLAKTTQGKKLLVIAGDLTPGSPAMKNLVQQIKTTLGATK